MLIKQEQGEPGGGWRGGSKLHCFCTSSLFTRPFHSLLEKKSPSSEPAELRSWLGVGGEDGVGCDKVFCPADLHTNVLSCRQRVCLSVTHHQP